ncbi:MarR family transcriptional regulator [Frondihabitans peucedani]|uniref:HTH marR-type domain-containing protein n=1 Tax=Frondihabitans peucedani TaxID=598626 RepID=A0ABP8E535_9MICO
MTTDEAPEGAAAAVPDDRLSALLLAFRSLLLEHNRVVIHQSEALSMGATDIRALAYLWSVHGDTTPKQVAEFLELSTGATTSLVDRLVASGSLVRLAHPTDRRSVLLRLTPEGIDAVTSLTEVYRGALAKAIPEGSYDEIAGVFRGIATALGTASAPPPETDHPAG